MLDLLLCMAEDGDQSKTDGTAPPPLGYPDPGRRSRSVAASWRNARGFFGIAGRSLPAAPLDALASCDAGRNENAPPGGA